MPLAADILAPSKSVTFTIDSVPATVKGKKTILRLMRMQPAIQRGLTRIAKRRSKFDNEWHQRGGRQWANRATPPKLAVVKAGESFTLRLTPQILADIRNVERYLSGKAAKN